MKLEPSGFTGRGLKKTTLSRVVQSKCVADQELGAVGRPHGTAEDLDPSPFRQLYELDVGSLRIRGENVRGSAPLKVEDTLGEGDISVRAGYDLLLYRG